MSNYKTATKSDIKLDLGTDSALMNLPFMNNFKVEDLKTSSGELKPGAKMIYHILAFLLGVGAIAGFAVYAAPIIFVALGKIIAIALSLGAIVLTYLARRPIIMVLETIARNFHKFAVRQEPFRILDRAREGQIDNRTNFHVAKGKVSNLKTQTESDAAESEAEAKEYQYEIQRALEKATEIKEKRAALLEATGDKDTDEYVELNSQWMRAVSTGRRLESKYKQAKDHTIKYGARAAVLGTLDRKLVLVGTSIDIKIDAFDATVEILKKEKEYSEKAKLATQTAKDAMLFTTGWELDYAIEVITETVINDIATTAANLRDINDFTDQHGVDSDELYASLERTANNIKIGEDVAPSAKKYKNPDYVLTTEDKKDLKGMESIFG